MYFSFSICNCYAAYIMGHNITDAMCNIKYPSCSLGFTTVTMTFSIPNKCPLA